MNNPEQHTSDSQEQLSGVHVDLIIQNPTALRSFIADTKSYHDLHTSDAGELPYPLHNARFSAYHSNERGARIETIASIDFTPPDTDEEQLHWQDDIMAELLCELTNPDERDDVIQLRHTPQIIYARLSTDYFASIVLEGDTRYCKVNLSLTHREELEGGLGHSIDTAPAEPDTDEYARLVAFARVWQQTIDAIASTYVHSAKNTIKKRRLYISVPEWQYDPSGSDDLEIVDEPAIELGVEHIVSDEPTLAMIGGMDKTKQHIEDLTAIINDPEGSKLYNIGAKSFILYGPPGTGKTTLIRAFAREIGAEIISVDSAEVVGKYIGESAKKMKKIFEEAIQLSETETVVLFIDEIDSLINVRNHPHSERIAVMKIMNTYISEIVANYANRIIIAGATNVDIDHLEPAIVRSGRLEPLSVALPTLNERVDIWAAVLVNSIATFNQYDGIEVASTESGELSSVGAERFIPYDTDINPPELAQMTDGMTGADFELILEKARMSRYMHHRVTGEIARVTQADLIKEIRSFYQR